jgi:membrane-associated phospholipid phosphatase
VAAVFALWPVVRRFPWAGRALDWLPFPLVLVTYDMLHSLVPRTWDWTIDPWLRDADRTLLGTDVGRLLEPLVHPALTAFFAACYVSYYVVPVAVGVRWYLTGRRSAFRDLMVGVVGLLFVGYVGYLLLPAKGPHTYLSPSHWGVPLDGDFASVWIRSRFAVHDGLAPRDAFPSLHTANAVTLLILTRRHDRAAFRAVAVPMIGLVAATMYLRFHYLVDVVAGAALAVAWDLLTRRLHGAAPQPDGSSVARTL